MGFSNELKVLLTGDSRGLSGEMKGAKKQVSGFGKDIKKIGGMLAGAFAVGSVLNYAKNVAGVADAQNKLARRLDITKGQADALELSLMKGGQTLQGQEKNLDYFNRKLGELEAGELEAADAFKRLGLAAKDFAGKDYTERLIMVKKGLDGMTHSARAFASQELFGRGGAKIYEGLSGLEESDKMIKEINKELGLTGDQVQSIESMNDSLTTTNKKLELITTTILTKLAPGIETMVTGLGKAAIEAVKFTSSFGKGMEAMGQRAMDEGGGFWGGVKGFGKTMLSRVGIGASDTEVMASAENKRLLAQGSTPESQLKQAQAKFDTNALRAAEEERAKAEEMAAEETKGFAELIGSVVNGLEKAVPKDVLKEDTESADIPMPGHEASLDYGEMPVEPMERRRGEAGVTSASGLYSVAVQGAMGGKQREQQRQISLQEQTVALLQRIANNGFAYV